MARVWDYMVGGRDNFEADRSAARQLLTSAPVLAQAAPVAWGFLGRAVSYLAAEAGIRQFIDIRMGMPAPADTHEFAQAVAPECRIVYVANDPVVLSHTRASLRSSAEGSVSCIGADLYDVAAIVAEASQTLNLAEPVAVVMMDILNFIEDAAAVVAGLVRAIAPGSQLVVMQATADERWAVGAQRWNRIFPVPVYLRNRSQVESWFAGLELIEPGIVEAHQWRPAAGDPEYPEGMPLLAAVARKR
jgi:hypothetical protein